jgi:hopanoid biosynthesis associated protein HpnK
MNEIKVIVHADDFGLTEEVNNGILQAHLHGILTSTSIMANGGAFEQALNIARSTPTLDVGIHLTLVEEKPLLDPKEIPALLTQEGGFHRNAFHFVGRYLLGRINLDEVRNELETQIQRVLMAGISPSHLDSHQHIHMLPRILDVVIELGHKYGIPAIRFPREDGVLRRIRDVPFTRFTQAMVLNLFCEMGKRKIKQKTDFFSGFLFGGNLNKENLLRILRNISRSGTYEIMCHPGLGDSNTHYSHWGYRWTDELRALTDRDISDLLRQRGIRLISYRQLC